MKKHIAEPKEQSLWSVVVARARKLVTFFRPTKSNSIFGMKIAARQTDEAKNKSRQNSDTEGKFRQTNAHKTSGKSIPFSSLQSRAQPDETGKLSIAQCKAILCKDGAVYSDEQVALIRQVLYALAEVDYKYHCNLKDQKAATIIPIHTTDNDQQESYSLHPRIYRRTG